MDVAGTINPLSGFNDFVLGLDMAYGYLCVGLMTLSESAVLVGFVLPGEVSVVLGGVLVQLGSGSLPLMVAVAFAGSFTGDTIGFAIGRAVGPRVLRTRFARRRAERIEAAQEFIDRKGVWAIFLLRWTAFFRSAVPMVAGMSRMSPARFLLANAAGALVWAAALATAGYLSGLSYAHVTEWIMLVPLAIVAAVIALVCLRLRAAGARRRARTPASTRKPT
ncbi:DedA family protein [Streptomonospora salina]|uniref:Membrane protein DedA with SNARE-associated domain n=1 Tax=Streptomonospora salina TaxID=104205 RepID=A0A841EDE3_9ACTN|nr:DedA family protein [Streptomonospora salina]MBB6001016.1 membrane protein DedA with SNARE-associated domain [Streptomonospora salina]